MKRLVIILLLLGSAGISAGQASPIETIVEGVYLRDSLMRSRMDDMTMAAETIYLRLKDDGSVKYEKRYLKTYYFKGDQHKAEFLEYYLDGVRQDEKAIKDEVKEAKEREKKGRNRDASINPLRLFYPESRADYTFTLAGTESKGEFTCFHVVAESKKDDDKILEGDFWVDTDSLRLIQTDFHPSAMPTTIKYLDMTMTYGPAADGFWLLQKFHMSLAGKALLVFKFKVSVDETYSNHKVNTSLADDLFRELEK